MRIAWQPRNRELGFVDVLGLIGALGLLTARFVPVARLPFWGCAFRDLTGWPCPGCGLTRVADHVSHGHLAPAWDANPLGTIAALIFAVLAVAMVLHVVFGLALPRVWMTADESRKSRAALVAAFIVNYAWVLVK